MAQAEIHIVLLIFTITLRWGLKVKMANLSKICALDHWILLGHGKTDLLMCHMPRFLKLETFCTIWTRFSSLWPNMRRIFSDAICQGWTCHRARSLKAGAGKDYHIQRNHVPVHVRIQCKTPHSSTISENPVFVNHE